MIFYGLRHTELIKEPLMEKCPHCGTQNSLSMHVFQKYAHIFWIPAFPMGKTGVSRCNHCRQVLKLKEMPVALKAAYGNLKVRFKTPIWTFSGLGLFIILVVFIIINHEQKKEKNARLILAPKVGDIFEVKTQQGQYTLFKVRRVEGDSVFIQPSNYEINKISGLHKLHSKSYSDDVYGFSKKELERMFHSREILDIERD